ncbi:MAG: hypothetical protein ACETWM_16740 [Candidatus Lokiarchaeia archaeon]
MARDSIKQLKYPSYSGMGIGGLSLIAYSVILSLKYSSLVYEGLISLLFFYLSKRPTFLIVFYAYIDLLHTTLDGWWFASILSSTILVFSLGLFIGIYLTSKSQKKNDEINH